MKFVSKTINDSNIDLDNFSASKVRQLAKKMKYSSVLLGTSRQLQGNPKQFKLKKHFDKSNSKKRYSSEHKNERPPLKGNV